MIQKRHIPVSQPYYRGIGTIVTRNWILWRLGVGFGWYGFPGLLECFMLIPPYLPLVMAANPEWVVLPFLSITLYIPYHVHVRIESAFDTATALIICGWVDG